MTKISVIIPCYNCAPVIERCLESIDYPEAEIIVVNDGSKDNSSEVVEHYIQTHSTKNVILINKPNGGVSSARNLGIKQATGKYIVFVDADDYLMADGLIRVVQIADRENADVVLYYANYTTEQNLVSIRSVAQDEIHSTIYPTGREVLKHFDIADYYIWDAVYSRHMIVDNYLVCKEDLHLHEDDVFKGEVYSVAGKVIVTDLRLYCYVQASNHSSTHSQSIERQRILMDSCWKAIDHRQAYIRRRCPEVMPYERLKYMRWVCTPKAAVESQMPYDEYISYLNEFRKLGVYPLSYKWIRAVHWYASRWNWLKDAAKTFLTNHPRLGYWFYQKRKNRKQQ